MGVSFEPVYPPRHLGVDTGNVLANVLVILESQVVLVNVTPSISKRKTVANPGVLIEYGMILGRAWASKDFTWPRPYYRLFCNSKFHRSSLPPLINQEDVTPFTPS